MCCYTSNGKTPFLFLLYEIQKLPSVVAAAVGAGDGACINSSKWDSSGAVVPAIFMRSTSFVIMRHLSAACSSSNEPVCMVLCIASKTGQSMADLRM